MAMNKLDTLVQSLLVRDVVVVAGSDRIGARLATQAPASLPSERLPANDHADPDNRPDYPPTGMNPRGVRAGRSVRSAGSLLSRCLPGRAGATRRAWDAGRAWAVKRLTTTAWRFTPGLKASGRADLGRSCPPATARGRRTGPVL